MTHVIAPPPLPGSMPPRPRPVPPFDVLGPDGRSWTVRPAGPGDTVADLARAMGIPPQQVVVEGRPAAPHRRLTSVPGLRAGARIAVGGSGGPDVAALGCAPAAVGDADDVERPRAMAEVAVVAGPSTTTWCGVEAGRHVVGRSRDATIRIGDPALEPHHGLLTVTEAGAVSFRQLTGVHVARLDGRPCADLASWEPGARLEIGSSVLELRQPPPAGGSEGPAAGGASAASPEDPWRHVVRRGHGSSPADWVAADLRAPGPAREHPFPPATALVGGVVGAIGALVMGVVLGHAAFALFALVGATASFATWAVGAIAARRRRLAERRAHDRAEIELTAALEARRAERRCWHAERHPTIVDALSTPRHAPARIWHRRADGLPVDRLRATIGVGDHRWSVSVTGTLSLDLMRAVERCERLPDVAAPVSLERGRVDAVRGMRGASAAVLRSVIVQLATWYGPADWALAVVTSDPAAWGWVRWLPQLAHVDGRPAVSTASTVDLVVRAWRETADERLLVVVGDDADVLMRSTDPLRRLLADRAVAVLVGLDHDTPAPASCHRVLEVGATWRARWSGPAEVDDETAGDRVRHTTSIRAAGVDAPTALEAARRLARFVDPELRGVGAGLPDAIGLFELLGAAPTAADVAARWRARLPDAPPVAPIGLGRRGVVSIDLSRDGPHGLLAGTTGSGKSELLRTLVASLALHVGPTDLTFVLIDYKGGATFDGCDRLPHTVGLVTDLDEGTAARALTSLEAEVRRRERLLREAGAVDLDAYRGSGPGEPVPRLVVVVDEFAALARELPTFLRSLVDVAQRGRSLGIHLLLATQRPAGVVSDDIRANTTIRAALRLPDAADAHDVVGDAAPVALPRAIPGRVVLRLGPEELLTFQSARCTGVARPTVPRLVAVPVPESPGAGVVTGALDPPAGGPTELELVVAAVNEAARRCGCGAPRRPWHAALPTVLRPEDLAAAPFAEPAPAALGMVDDPRAQAVRPLTWSPADGTLALVGATGSGLTSTVIALVASACRGSDPGALHVYVVDGHGDDRLDALAAVEHCAGVVRLHERERLHRLLGRVASTVDRPGGHRGPATPRRTVVVIDGVGPLRRALSAPEEAETEALLDRALRDGAPAGVVAVLADHGAAGTGTWPVAERWRFHAGDPALLAASGSHLVDVPADVPGRLRINSSGLEAQVALGAAGLAALPTRTGDLGPPAIGVLPTEVGQAHLAAAGDVPRPPAGVTRLTLGLGAEDLAPQWLDVPAGEHVLVLGTARSGVTTALTQLARSWARQHGLARVAWWPTAGPGAGDEAGLPDHGGDRPRLVVVDDAHRIDDDGRLAALAAGPTRTTLLVGARVETVRASYGHWTRDAARSRCGIVMTSTGVPDGELLGASLPVRTRIPARPGLGWVIDGAGSRLVQVARPGSRSR